MREESTRTTKMFQIELRLANRSYQFRRLTISNFDNVQTKQVFKVFFFQKLFDMN